MELSDPPLTLPSPSLLQPETLALCISKATSMDRKNRRRQRRMEMKQFKQQIFSHIIQEANTPSDTSASATANTPQKIEPKDSPQKPQNACLLLRQETMAFVIDSSTMAADRNPRRTKLRKLGKVSARPLASRGIFHVCFSEQEEEEEVEENGETHSISGIDTMDNEVSIASELIIRQFRQDSGVVVTLPEIEVVKSRGLLSITQINGSSTDVKRSTVSTVYDNDISPLSQALEAEEKEEKETYKGKDEEMTIDGAAMCFQSSEQVMAEDSSCGTKVVHGKLPSIKEEVEKKEATCVFSSLGGVCSEGKDGEEIDMGMDMENCEGSDLPNMDRAQNEGSFTSAKCPPCGKLLFCGERREMEDTGVIVPSFTKLHHHHYSGGEEIKNDSIAAQSSDLHFFAVYDGHGGSQASKYCAARLHHVLADEIARYSISKSDGYNKLSGFEGIDNESMWKNVMSSCFLKMDKEVGGVCPHGLCDNVSITTTTPCCIGTVAPEHVGTTALVSILSSTQIVVANCGDSRAVLSRGGTVIPLSTDHKPNRDDETSRIERAGGRIIYWNGYRVGGLLAVSRSIGDRYLKRYVVSEPDVVCINRTEEDECLIIASDGLWDVISNDMACDVARRYFAHAYKKNNTKKETSEPSSTCSDAAASSVAALLVKLAYAKGSKDNISVVVVDLKSRSK